MRGKNPTRTERSRGLRRVQTDAEALLWKRLSDRQLSGHKVRRQFPIGTYFADFACPEKKLIVELDGGQHIEQTNYDAQRTSVLEAQGYAVPRFWNDQVLNDTDAVLAEILRVLSER